MDKRCDHDYIVQMDAEIVVEADEETSAEEVFEEATARRTIADAELKDGKMPISSKYHLKFDDILSNPVPPIDAQLYTGVLLNGEYKMFYWVDPITNKNCFRLFVGGLHIVNDESRYWGREQQPLIEGNTDDFIEIARLKTVCWLEFGGSFDVSKLSSKTWYIVLFEVKLNKKVDEWTGWSTVSVTLPEYMSTRVKHEHKVNMKAQEKGKWVEISVGVFNTSIITKGKIDFNFFKFGDWISGIEVRSAKIQPLEEMKELIIN